MPIYDYECAKCGHEFEREQRITEDPVKTCPRCKSRKAKRLISRTSFVLRGGGWHSDLYSSSDGKKKDKDDSSSKSESTSDKSDSKPGKSDKSDSGKGDSKSGKSKSSDKSGKGSKSKASKAA